MYWISYMLSTVWEERIPALNKMVKRKGRTVWGRHESGAAAGSLPGSVSHEPVAGFSAFSLQFWMFLIIVIRDKLGLNHLEYLQTQKSFWLFFFWLEYFGDLSLFWKGQIFLCSFWNSHFPFAGDGFGSCPETNFHLHWRWGICPFQRLPIQHIWDKSHKEMTRSNLTEI